jgi:hypothetical protein
MMKSIPKMLCLLALIEVSGCGHHDSPPTGPYSDIAGHYVATCTDRTGAYVSQVALGDDRNATVSIYGILTTTDSVGSQIQYVLRRQPDGTFLTDARDLGSNGFEAGRAPASLSPFVVTLYDTAGTTALGTVTYYVARAAGG